MSNNFTPIQKASLALLLFLGLTSLVLAFPYFNSRVKGPFLKDKTKTYKTLEERERQKLAELKTQDTDSDKLNDYDELYIYRTSPYLDDTDSDGASDEEEVRGGSDPNCPKNQDCAGSAFSGEAAPPGTTTALPPPPADALGALNQLQNLGAGEIRELLLKSGLPQDVLNKIDDETLKAIYQDALKSASASGTEEKAEVQNP